MPEAAIADGVAAAVSHPLTVQVINQGPGIWGNVATGLITGLLTGGIALTGIWLTHRFTLRREQKASEDKLQKERYFIATELVFLLEQFAEGCGSVATDRGYKDHDGISVPGSTAPELDYSVVTGDWRALPAVLMYRSRELPVLISSARRTVRDVDSFAPDYEEFFSERHYQYTRLGLKAIILARRIRKLVGFPEARLDASPWSAQQVLWKEWRLERARRSVQARLHAQALAVFEIVNPTRKADDDAHGTGDDI